MQQNTTNPFADGYRAWISETGLRLRSSDPPPNSADEVRARAARIRGALQAAAGEWPEKKCPLTPQTLGVIKRDGYRIERLVFQTREGVFATASLYLPTASGRLPAVLGVHGHWSGARRDPVVQSRCAGLAKLGFVCLTLDAWGAGERGTVEGRNEYHGGLLGAGLWPTGTPLWGLQLYDNVRALDLLQSRPEVDPNRLGCTGASGGGNQTTHLAAFDPRIKCAVPVCSVGTWHDYLQTACCVDEVVRGGLTFAEEGDLLGIVAPGSVLVITASRDSYHFGPISAREAVDRAHGYFAAMGKEANLRHQVFESGHDYSRPMREAMYGWMARGLRSEGDGSPIPDPSYRIESPADLACFPPGGRPPLVMTTVSWISRRTRQATGQDSEALAGEHELWKAERDRRIAALIRALGLTASKAAIPAWGAARASFRTRDGVELPIRRRGEGLGRPMLLVSPLGSEAALQTRLADQLSSAGHPLWAITPRGCAELTLPGQALGADIPDHTLVEWGLWIGRPLLGQWVADILDACLLLGADGPSSLPAILGWRESALAVLAARALEPTIPLAVALGGPATFQTEGVPHAHRMAIFCPDLLAAGDIPMLSALAAPAPVMVLDPVRLDGMPADEEQTSRLYQPVRALYHGLGRTENYQARTGLLDVEIKNTIEELLRRE